MEPMWLIPLSIALVLVPSLFGFWAWAEVIERIREDHAAIGRRTRALRFALVAATASYLVGVGTSLHPATFELLLTASLPQRLAIFLLIAVPWAAFGVIGLLARNGRRTGLRGFLKERDRQEQRLDDTHQRALSFLHTIGVELEAAVRQIQGQADGIQTHFASLAGGHEPGPEGLTDTMAELRGLAATLRVPEAPEPTELLIDPYLSDGLDGVRSLAEDRGVSVYRSGPEDCRVHAVPEHLRQVLQVVLEGAIERAPRDEGLVVITIATDGPRGVEIAVTDNGRTIADADLTKAFALDLPGTQHDALPGLGFPLAIARRLARQDGGEIEISPAASGGTVVSLQMVRREGGSVQEAVSVHAR